jgi:hypothetical protein
VSQRVVNHLEAIQIHKQDRKLQPGATVPAQGLVKALVQHQSIGEGGKIVMKGYVIEPVLRAIPLVRSHLAFAYTSRFYGL